MIEGIFASVFLMQFVISLFLLGLAGFETTVTAGFTRSQFNVCFYCACILIELFLMCYAGHLVMDEVGIFFFSSSNICIL